MDADDASQDAHQDEVTPVEGGAQPDPVAGASDAAPAGPNGPPTGDDPREEGAPAPTAPPRRALKLVVTLRPDDGGGYRALLALGADGCDPVLRAVEAADLAAALDEVPALVAEAEARWQARPRNPAAGPAARARPAAPSPPPAPPPTSTAEPAPPEAPPGDAPAAAGEPPARAGQLSLFG